MHTWWRIAGTVEKKKEKKKEKAHALPLSQDIKLWGEG